MSSNSLGDSGTSSGAAPCNAQRWYSSRLWSSPALGALIGSVGSTIRPKTLASTLQASKKLEPIALIRGSSESEPQSTIMWAVAALEIRERPSGVGLSGSEDDG